MRGLLLKDLLNLKSQGKFFIALILIYMVIGVIAEVGGMFAGFIVVVVMMMPISAMSYDERSKWDRYALTMPITRGELVLGKYVLSFTMVMIAVAVGAVFLMITSKGMVMDSILSTIAIAGASLIYLGVMLPTLYKFGTEKGRVLMIIMIVIPFALAGGLGSFVTLRGEEIRNGAMYFLNSGRVILFGIGILIFIASYFLSVKIYSKKEF